MRRTLQARLGERLDAPAGQVWLQAPRLLTRAVAAAAWAESPLGPQVLPQLLLRLDADNPYERLRILQAVEAILGRRLAAAELDLTGDSATRWRQIDALLKGIVR